MRLRIVHLAPGTLHQNGEVGNVLTLRRRAEARGIETTLVRVDQPDQRADDADLLFIGTGPLAAQRQAQPLIWALAGQLSDAIGRGVPLLAIAAGFQLLGKSVRLDDGEELRGAGLLPVSTVVEGPRVVGDFIVRTRLGDLVGFENRGARIDIGDASPLGSVVYGQGNAPGSGVEGLWRDAVIGTHLQGPVLANNPALADWLLERAVARRGETLPPVPPSLDVMDRYAAHARAAIVAHPRSE